MSTETTNYLREASSDAGDTILNFEDEILEMLLDKGEASDDLLNDYPNGDSYHHESHVDKDYSFRDAAELIVQLDEFEETDSGLWEGQDMKQAVSICAAFTYGNAVYHEWRKKIEQINSHASDIISDYDEKIAELEGASDDDLSDDETALRNDDLETLQEEKKEALRKMIQEEAASA